MNIYPTHKEKSFLEYNLIENPSPETNFKGWAAGTGSGSAPTAQVASGASDLVISRNQSSPLFGSADFHIAKPASNCQGQFYFTEFVIPKGLEFQPLDVEFLTRNVDLLEGDVKLFVIEKATDSVIQIPFGDVFGEGLLRFQFQALASGVYQFVFWVSSTNAVAWDLYFDQLKVYPAKGQFIPFVSDLEDAGTMIIGATTTPPTKGTTSLDRVQIAAEGQFAILKYEFINTSGGSGGSGDYLISLPNNLRFDLSKVVLYTGSGFDSNNTHVDSTVKFNYSGRGGVGVIVPYDSTRFRVWLMDSRNGVSPPYSGAGFWGSTYTSIQASMAISINARVPIQGWTSGAKTQAQLLQNVPVIMVANHSGGSSSTTSGSPFGNWVTLKDTVGAFSPSTGVYTVKVPGDYYAYVLGQTSGDTPLFISSSSGNSVPHGRPSATFMSGGFRLLHNLKVGDTIFPATQGNGTVASSTTTTFGVFKINTPDTMYTINRSTTKYLATSKTSSATNIAELAMSNLIIGKKYEIMIVVRGNFSGLGNQSAALSAVHNGSTISQAFISPQNWNNGQAVTSTTMEFTATATTLTFNATLSGSTPTLFGNGTYQGTYVTLTELNNTVEGNF